MLPFGGRYGLHVESTEDDYINLYQDIKGDDFWRLAGKPVTVQIWGRGPLPTGARLSVVTNYGSGGSTLSDTFTVIRAVSGSDKLWHASATLQTGTPVGKTIGTTPYHRVQFISPSLATWDVDIFGIFAEVGDTPSRFEGVDFDEDRVRCRRRLKTLDFAGFDQLIDGMAVGTTGFWGTLTWTEMAAAPVISLKTGAASDLRIYTDEIDGTDVVFERRMPDRCSLRLTAAGLTANKPGILRVKSGSNVSLLLDAE